MGNCTSSGGPSKAFPMPPSSRVIHPDGRMLEFRLVVTAREVVAENPGHFLCCSESIQVDSNVTMVEDQEELQRGQLYFLMPLADSHRPLALPDLCALAVRASAALTRAACIGHVLAVDRCRNISSRLDARRCEFSVSKFHNHHRALKS